MGGMKRGGGAKKNRIVKFKFYTSKSVSHFIFIYLIGVACIEATEAVASV